MRKILEKLMQRQDLSSSEVHAAMRVIISGATPEEVAAFLVLLHSKGETSEELAALVDAMRAEMKTVKTDVSVLDIVGTGGDNANTVNISTASSLLAAACGAYVVKHGNRSVSSQCGSADLLAALGVEFSKKPEAINQSLKKRRFAFCFSPYFHPSMSLIKDIRKALGIRTSFNLIGPLLNPANAQYLLLGVFSPKYLTRFADTVEQLGVDHAMLVHSCGLDELSLLGLSTIIDIQDGKKEQKTLDPKQFGFNYCTLSDIQGGDSQTNKQLIEQALSGDSGPIADTIVLNTGAALYVADLVPDIGAGIALASEKIKTGSALKVLN